MRVAQILPLATLATAFVVPDAKVFENLAIEPRRQSPIKAGWANLEHKATAAKDGAINALDQFIDTASDVEDKVESSAADVLSWSKSRAHQAWDVFDSLKKEHHHPPPHHPHGPPEHDPHHGPPHDGPPHHGKPPCHGKLPHHGPKEPSDKSIYQMIAGSQYTTKLTKLINKFPDVVERLNSTDFSSTIFVPTDEAFEKIPKHAEKPDEETLEHILKYHITPHLYPARRVLHTHTIPTLLEGHHLSSEARPQRLSINLGFRGLTVNFYSRIIAIDFFCTNGVIHAVDSILVPPPNVIEIIDLLPTEFSTLELALDKTGLLDKFNSTDHPGGTLFAPSNFAFKKLGPKINMFLFSNHGLKYLKALLLYHVATGTTLYSDAAYVAHQEGDSPMPSFLPSEYAFLGKKPCHKQEKREARAARKPFDPEAYERHHSKRSLIFGGGEHHPPHHKKPHAPKYYHHYDLPTMLGDEKLNVDVVRYGPYIGMKVNGFSRVVVQDGIAQDGVIQVVSDVLIPPHGDHMTRKSWSPLRRIKSMLGIHQHMSVCEFKARFRGLVEEN